MSHDDLKCKWNKCSNVVLRDGYCTRHLKQKCSICFETVPSTNSAKHKRLKCGHAFHFDCIIQWYAESDVCPVCRQSQNQDPLIQFKKKIEKKMRRLYRDAIISLETEIRQMSN